MANVKFSDFAVRTTIPTVDYIVGYQGADNIQIAPTDFLGDYLPLGGGTMVGNINFNDNVYARFGTGSDLDIGHDASNSYISHNGVGNLIIQNTEDNADIIFKSDDGSGGVATYFYLDGSAANPGNYLITLFPDNSRLVLGDGWDIQMWHDGVDGKFYNATGDWSFEQAANDKDIIFYCDDGAGGTTEYFKIDGQYEVNRFLKNARFNDDVKANFGTGDDLQIYHDASNSYIKDTGAGELRLLSSGLSIMSATGSEYIAYFAGTGAQNASLYAGNVKKFETTATGIEVTDEVSIGTSLVHTGDTDTKVTFGTNNITLIAGGATHFVAVSDQTTILYSGNAQTLFCDTNQNVGIGNNNPNQSGLGIDHTVVTIGTAAGMGMVELTGTRTVDGDLGRLTWLNAATRRSEIVVSRIDEDTSTKMAFSTSNAGSMGTRMTIAKDGNVGIGGSSPTAKLHLYTSGSEAINLGIQNSERYYKIETDGGLLTFNDVSAGGTARMTIDSSGNIGIGTATPQVTLDVDVGNADGMGVSFAGSIATGEYQGVHFGYSEDANPNYRKSGIVFERTDASARGKIHILNNAQAGNNSAILSDSRVTIQYDGNVGIGTTTPGVTLDVTGGSGIRITNTTARFYMNNNTVQWKLQVEPNTDNGLRFNNGISDTVVFDYGGNVGIGTDTPTAALQVVGLAEHADNAAALLAGLTAGAFYRTGDLLKVVH